jgi:putative transposase
MTKFANVRRFRVLNIVDDVTKECLGAVPETSISATAGAGADDDRRAVRGKAG